MKENRANPKSGRLLMKKSHQIVMAGVLIVLVAYAWLIGYGMCNSDGLFC